MAKSRKGLKRVTGTDILETSLHGLADRRKRSVGDIVLHGLLNGSDILLLSLRQVPHPNECLDRDLIHRDPHTKNPSTRSLPMGAHARG